jgi:hypothetical protein
MTVNDSQNPPRQDNEIKRENSRVLRNLTGRINGDGTVTLWATTATSSASGDNGADPNKVVEITDQIAAAQAGNQSFATVAGPVYSTVFRGVGFVE